MRRFAALIAVAFVAAALLPYRDSRMPRYAKVADAAPANAAPARVSTGTITLPTARIDRFSYTPVPFAMDDVGRGYPYLRADRDRITARTLEYDNVTWRTVVLENEYLRVTLLPDLGGRLYDAVFKPTGKSVFHRLDRIQPYELWGGGKEWMYATAGLRFEFPRWGHDPDTEEPWDFATREWPTGAATATFSHRDVSTGITLANHVSLDPGRAWIRLDLELANPNDHPEPAAVWVITGFLSTRGVEFIMPTDLAIEHGGEDTDRWPVSDGRDWSYFRNWNNQRAFFALDWKSEFSGIYDHEGDFGVVRWANPKDAPGLKLWGDPQSMGRFYVSLYGGITQTMEERLTMAPGAVKRWQELWYPLAGTRGLTEANREIALSLHADDGKLVLGIQSTCARTGTRTLVTRGGKTLFEKRQDLTPAITIVDEFAFIGDAKDVTVQVTDSDGRVLIEKTFAVDAICPAFVKRNP